MQEICRMRGENAKRLERRRNGKKYAGEKRIGERPDGPKKSGRVEHETATAATKSTASSTAMQREPRFGGCAEYQACGAIRADDGKRDALETGI